MELFGSQVSGSAIHSSDMDVVVLNLATPPLGGHGYPKAQRPRVRLHQVLPANPCGMERA